MLPLVAPCGGRASFACRLHISGSAGFEQRVVIRNWNGPQETVSLKTWKGWFTFPVLLFYVCPEALKYTYL